MDYENPRAKRDEGGAPHPDYQVNYLYYNRMLGKVIFAELVKCHEERHDGNITYSQFTYGVYGQSRTALTLNFHKTIENLGKNCVRYLIY